jgi:hypothetical protein
MSISPGTARRLAAARDLLAVAVFLALAVFGCRAMADSPALQKERLTRKEAREDIAEFFERVEKVHPNHLAYLTAER